MPFTELLPRQYTFARELRLDFYEWLLKAELELVFGERLNRTWQRGTIRNCGYSQQRLEPSYGAPRLRCLTAPLALPG